MTTRKFRNNDLDILWFILGFAVSYLMGLLYLVFAPYPAPLGGIYGSTAGIACGIIKDLSGYHDEDNYGVFIPTTIGAILAGTFLCLLMNM